MMSLHKRARILIMGVFAAIVLALAGDMIVSTIDGILEGRPYLVGLAVLVVLCILAATDSAWNWWRFMKMGLADSRCLHGTKAARHAADALTFMGFVYGVVEAPLTGYGLWRWASAWNLLFVAAIPAVIIGAKLLTDLGLLWDMHVPRWFRTYH